LLKGAGTEGDWGILFKLKIENVGADIIRPFKKRRFAREHLIRQNLRFCHLPLKGKAMSSGNPFVDTTAPP